MERIEKSELRNVLSGAQPEFTANLRNAFFTVSARAGTSTLVPPGMACARFPEIV